MKQVFQDNEHITSNSAQLAVLKEHFPNCFDKAGAFLPEKLQAIVESAGVGVSHEGYSLDWLGRSYARLLANENVRTLLKADKAHNDLPENAQSKNLLIKGDNLEVLKHLSGAYREQVKMIYIDPPYNTGSDGFVYADDRKFTVDELSRMAGIDEEQATRVLDFTNSKSNSHSAWLTFMYPRLYVARRLLRDDGVIFVSIDDNEQAQLKLLMDEVFGEDCFVECISWNKRIPKNDKGIGNIHESILLYVKNNSRSPLFTMRKDGLKDVYELLEKLKRNKIPLPEAEVEIKKLYKKNGYDRGITLYRHLTEDYRLWGKINMSWPNAETFGDKYKVLHPITGKPVKIPDRGWRWVEETFNSEAMLINGSYQNTKTLHDGSVVCGRIWFAPNELTQPSSINYLDDVNNLLLRSILSTKSDGGVELENLFEGKSYFSYPKPTSLIKTLAGSIPWQANEICLDFFAGSGTTAHAVMELNVEENLSIRSFSVQLPEPTDKTKSAYKAGYHSIFDITRERIKRAAAKIKADKPEYAGDLGCKVFETIPVFDGYLDDPEELTDNLEIFDGSHLGHEERQNLLLTWAAQDGIPLTENLEAVILHGLDDKDQPTTDYTAYRGGSKKHILYLVDSGLTIDHVVALLVKIDEDEDFAPTRIVAFESIFTNNSKTKRELDESIRHFDKHNRKSLPLELEYRY